MNNIEINIPEGCATKQEKTENGINIIFIKDGKKNFVRNILKLNIIRRLKHINKKIEINIPKGYDIQQEKTDTGINIIFVVEDKKKKMQEFLREKLNGTTIKINKPWEVLYMKDGIVLFKHYRCGITSRFYVNYDEIWSVFEKNYNINYYMIKMLISDEIKSNLKIEPGEVSSFKP